MSPARAMPGGDAAPLLVGGRSTSQLLTAIPMDSATRLEMLVRRSQNSWADNIESKPAPSSPGKCTACNVPGQEEQQHDYGAHVRCVHRIL
jgi:hypothetical protein